MSSKQQCGGGVALPRDLRGTQSGSLPVFLDAAAPALLVAQAIGRIGNYFNQELFGGPTTLPWGLEISPAHRPVGYAQYATFHPTFLYELIWNLLLAGALIWLGRHRRIRAPGLFALYVAGYSFGRIGEELLRVDPAHRILGLRLNLYVASILCLAGIAWFIRVQRAGKETSSGETMRRGGALLATGGLLALTRLRPGVAREQRPHTDPPTCRPTVSRRPYRTPDARPARRLLAAGLPASTLGRLEHDRGTVAANLTGPRVAALVHRHTGDG
jgi:Prolipoprotein diacylglyceryl transferase